MTNTNPNDGQRPTVYIVNRSAHNFSPAEQFGELMFMTQGLINRFAISEIYRTFQEFLQNSKPEDYLLVSGMSSQLVVATAILAQKHGRVNFLLWKDGEYLERTLMLEGGEE